MKINQKILLIIFLTIIIFFLINTTSFAITDSNLLSWNIISDQFGNVRFKKTFEENAIKIIILNLIIGFVFFCLMKKHIKDGKIISFDFKQKVEYYKEIPDEQNATPARAMRTYSLQSSYEISYNYPEIFASTLMDLCLKGFLEFEVAGVKDVTIKLTEQQIASRLPDDEKIIYDILLENMNGANTVNSKELKKCFDENSKSIFKQLRKLEPTVKEYEKNKGNIDTDLEKRKKKYNRLYIFYIAMFSIMCLIAGLVKDMTIPIVRQTFFVISAYFPTLFLGSLIGMGVAYYHCSDLTASERCYLEALNWAGLIKYMLDYPKLKLKDDFKIERWEKYMVYAAVFRLSDQIIEDFNNAFPEMFSGKNDYSNYKLWNLVCKKMGGESAFKILQKELEDVCKETVLLDGEE